MSDFHVCPRHDFDHVADPAAGCARCNYEAKRGPSLAELVKTFGDWPDDVPEASGRVQPAPVRSVTGLGTDRPRDARATHSAIDLVPRGGAHG